MKSTTYIVEIITTQKNEKYLGREIHLLGLLLALCQLRNFPLECTEKCFAVFDQSSRAIYLTWYRSILFFREFFFIILYIWLQDSSQILVQEDFYLVSNHIDGFFFFFRKILILFRSILQPFFFFFGNIYQMNFFPFLYEKKNYVKTILCISECA